MYIFNRITVNPQLPKRIEKLSVISNNLWWSWNTEFLRLFRKIDQDLWEKCNSTTKVNFENINLKKRYSISKRI